MGKDAIARLGRLAALHEKTAALPPGLGRTLMNAGSKLFTKAAPGGGRAFSPLRTAATGLVGGDMLHGMAGGWGGDGNLSWHKQRLLGDQGMGSALGAAVKHPLKSVASLFAGQGPDSIPGKAEVSGGEWVPDPTTPGRSIYRGGQTTQSNTWSPRVQGQADEYDYHKRQYEDRRATQQAKLDQERSNLTQGNYGGGWRRLLHPFSNAADERMSQEAKIRRLQEQMDTNDYGSGWFSRGAKHHLNHMTAAEGRLRGAGYPLPGYGGQPAMGGVIAPPRPATSGGVPDWDYGLMPSSGAVL